MVQKLKEQDSLIIELNLFLNVCLDSFARVTNPDNFMLIKETCTISSHIAMIVDIQPVCRPSSVMEFENVILPHLFLSTVVCHKCNRKVKNNVLKSDKIEVRGTLAWHVSY